MSYGVRWGKYGVPNADKILVNHCYTLGYSYFFKQAKWALEIVDSRQIDLDRSDNFRVDFRIPKMFRGDLVDYQASGYDRGHLVASGDQNDDPIYNSETFLLSNISPQSAGFNRGIWRQLELSVRALDAQDDIYEVYVITGPIFDFHQGLDFIGRESKDFIPVPNAFFKTVLAENKNGSLDMWAFIIPNDKQDQDLHSFLVPVSELEKRTGIIFWDLLVGEEINNKKNQVLKMW